MKYQDRTTTPAAAPPAPVGANWATVLLTATFALLLFHVSFDLFPDDTILGTWKWVRLATVLGLALGVAAMLTTRTPLLQRGLLGLPQVTPYDLPVLGLVGLVTLSTLVGRTPWSSWRGFVFTMIALYVVVFMRRAVPRVGPALGLLAMAGVAIAGGIASKDFLRQTKTVFCRGSLDGKQDTCAAADVLYRQVGTFENPNLLAAFLVTLLPLVVLAAVHTRDVYGRVAAFSVVALGVVGVLSTVSRNALLALVAAAVVWWVLSAATWARLRVAALVSAAVAVVAGAGLVLSGGGLGLRTDMYAAATKIALKNPLGVGVGGAGSALRKQLPGTEAFQHAHNLWLNWTIELGFLGGALWLAIFAVAAVSVWRAARAGSVHARAVGAGLAAFVVMSFGDHPANLSRIALLLWMFLAFAVTCSDHLLPVSRAVVRDEVDEPSPDETASPVAAGTAVEEWLFHEPDPEQLGLQRDLSPPTNRLTTAAPQRNDAAPVSASATQADDDEHAWSSPSQATPEPATVVLPHEEAAHSVQRSGAGEAANVEDRWHAAASESASSVRAPEPPVAPRPQPTVATPPAAAWPDWSVDEPRDLLDHDGRGVRADPRSEPDASFASPRQPTDPWSARQAEDRRDAADRDSAGSPNGPYDSHEPSFASPRNVVQPVEVRNPWADDSWLDAGPGVGSYAEPTRPTPKQPAADDHDKLPGRHAR